MLADGTEAIGDLVIAADGIHVRFVSCRPKIAANSLFSLRCERLFPRKTLRLSLPEQPLSGSLSRSTESRQTQLRAIWLRKQGSFSSGMANIVE